MKKKFKNKKEFQDALSAVAKFKKASKETLIDILKENGDIDLSDEDISFNFIDYDGTYEINKICLRDNDIKLDAVSWENGDNYVFWWYEFEQDVEAVNILVCAVFDIVNS